MKLPPGIKRDRSGVRQFQDGYNVRVTFRSRVLVSKYGLKLIDALDVLRKVRTEICERELREINKLEETLRGLNGIAI